jgi:hypothetical protein
MSNHVMQYFDTTKRTTDVRIVGAALPAEALAAEWDDYLPDGPEKSVALRKLLEGKDAACRASLALEVSAVDSETVKGSGCCQSEAVSASE